MEATVTRYNDFVDMGHDQDFERPDPSFKIQTPPFYAAWATPVVHDCYAGLRINMKCQVMDMNGQVTQACIVVEVPANMARDAVLHKDICRRLCR